MLFLTAIILALAASATLAKTLFVSSYTGTITTLNLTSPKDGQYQLSAVSSDTHSQPNASWIQLDRTNKNIFVLDENIIGTNGSINSYKILPETGALSPVTRHATPAAPVNSALYTNPNGSQLLVVAHYAFAISTWYVNPLTADFCHSQTFNITLPKPGPNAERQAASHPHQVLIDPTSKYLIIPDLGGDVLRIFYVDPSTLKLSTRPDIPVPAGSGPRHGRFLKSNQGGKDVMYYHLLTELSNQLLSFKVDYLPQYGGMSFTSIGKGMPTYGTLATNTNSTDKFKFNAASEIYISKDAKNIYVSNRNASSALSFEAKNGTKMPSDTMAHFTIGGGQDWVPKFAHLTPAGGLYPRHFSLSPDGKMAAVGLQLSGKVAIFEVKNGTGQLGEKSLAEYEGLGNVTSVFWG